MTERSKFRRNTLFTLLAAAGAALVAAPYAFHATPAAAGQTTVALSYNIPTDIPGGASHATISDAAIFAWEEFIALNWPANTEAGSGTVDTRGMPDKNAQFGDDSKGANNGVDTPVVWETLRSKVETFPGAGDPPGYQPNINADYGYDAAPKYLYGKRTSHSVTIDGKQFTVQDNPGGAPVEVAPCDPSVNPITKPPAWVNLDEINQIGDDSMFSGLLPYDATPVNREPQLIRYLAKGNRGFYDYVAANQYWYQGMPFAQAQDNFQNAVAPSNNSFPPKTPYIRLPQNTILVKAAWRELASTDKQSDYHTKTVRYYEQDPTTKNACYRERVWALIALHIIQKTKSAPYFVYATFEHADNIVTQTGQPVENQDGGFNPNPPSGSTTPNINYFDVDGKYYSPAYPNDSAPSGSSPPPPPQSELPIAQFDLAQCSVGASSTNKQLYYRNLLYSNDNGTYTPLDTPGEPICIDKRYFDIPQQIQAVNTAAHAALTKAGAPSLWQNYKLVDVQWQPFSRDNIDATNDARLPAIYYQANIVVETDNGLQQFFGNPVYAHNIFIKSYYTSADLNSGLANNVFVPPTTRTDQHFTDFNMGGCMGCHGNAQKSGTDFSFTLQGGPVSKPEFPVSTAVGLTAASSGIDLDRLTRIRATYGKAK